MPLNLLYCRRVRLSRFRIFRTGKCVLISHFGNAHVEWFFNPWRLQLNCNSPMSTLSHQYFTFITPGPFYYLPDHLASLPAMSLMHDDCPQHSYVGMSVLPTNWRVQNFVVVIFFEVLQWDIVTRPKWLKLFLDLKIDLFWYFALSGAVMNSVTFWCHDFVQIYAQETAFIEPVFVLLP